MSLLPIIGGTREWLEPLDVSRFFLGNTEQIGFGCVDFKDVFGVFEVVMGIIVGSDMPPAMIVVGGDGGDNRRRKLGGVVFDEEDGAVGGDGLGCTGQYFGFHLFDVDFDEMDLGKLELVDGEGGSADALVVLFKVEGTKILGMMLIEKGNGGLAALLANDGIDTGHVGEVVEGDVGT